MQAYASYVWVLLTMLFTLAANGVADRPATRTPDWLQEPAPAPALDEYELLSRGDGFVYEERAFTARIARDGVVSFDDRRIYFDRVGVLPRPLPGALPLPTLGWLLFERPREPSPGPPPVPAAPFPGSPADPIDYSVLCPEPSTCYALPGWLVVAGVSVTADLTDEILRALDQDPYRIQKAEFLAATFEVRMTLAVQAYQDDVRTSLDDLPVRLAELWHDQRYSPPERRRILFELWREADQSDVGVQARDIILRFVRRILPCESPDAYPSAELKALQASEPGQAFSPYEACGR